MPVGRGGDPRTVDMVGASSPGHALKTVGRMMSPLFVGGISKFKYLHKLCLRYVSTCL